MEVQEAAGAVERGLRRKKIKPYKVDAIRAKRKRKRRKKKRKGL